MIRIFAAKSFLFSNGEEEVEVKNREMKEVPDWVADTQLFKLAEIDGNIQIMESKAVQKEVEKTGTTTKQAKKKEKAEEEKSATDKE